MREDRDRERFLSCSGALLRLSYSLSGRQSDAARRREKEIRVLPPSLADRVAVEMLAEQRLLTRRE